jgi:hypothetical protein
MASLFDMGLCIDARDNVPHMTETYQRGFMLFQALLCYSGTTGNRKEKLLLVKHFMDKTFCVKVN